jgi:hypothetical protein
MLREPTSLAKDFVRPISPALEAAKNTGITFIANQILSFLESLMKKLSGTAHIHGQHRIGNMFGFSSE